MKTKISCTLILAILLSACAAEPQSAQSTPTRTKLPIATDAPTVTKSQEKGVKTPTTHTPAPSTTATPTSQDIATIAAVLTQNAQQLAEKYGDPTQVMVELTQASDLAIQQITPTQVPVISYCDPVISSWGVLAFVQNDILWVEGQPGYGVFFPIARNALCSFGWSPDGNRLLYSIAVSPGDYKSMEYWVWQQDAQTATPLYEIAPEITSQTRSGNYYSGDFYWSPDSQKILFFALFVHDDPDAWMTKISFIDLEKGSLDSIEVPDNVYFADWLGPKHFYTLSHCGTSCTTFVHFTYPGLTPVHSFDLPTMGLLAFSSDSSFVVNTGQHFREELTSTVDLMQTSSGVVEEIYVLPEGGYFFGERPPLLSTNEQMIVFIQYGDAASLTVIDLNGKVIAELPPALPLSWVGNEGILALNNPFDEILMYLPLDGSEPQRVAPEGFAYTLEEIDNPVEHWSRNRRWYAFAADAEETGTDALFIWDVRNKEAILVDSNQESMGYGPMFWMPDSYSLYYSKGNSLWRYFITTGESDLVIPAP